MHYPWQILSDWQPFQVDALGLITLLGSEDVDTWVGRLVPSRWVEYMPLLGMYVIAGDRFQRKLPSFLLYNISKGIHTTDCAAWFTRWIQCQRFETTRSIVYWETIERPQSQLADHIIAACVSLCLTGFLLVLTVLSHDFYGLANACAIIVSIVARAYVLSANRTTIDRAIPEFASGAKADKLIIITPDSKVITMFVPSSTIIPVFIRNPHPRPQLLYKAVRWLNWLAFGVHVVTLGMASLPTQIYTVALVIVSSVLLCVGCGCADMARPPPNAGEGWDARAYTCWIGSHLKATVFEWPSHLEFRKIAAGRWQFRGGLDTCHPAHRSTKRMDLYAWLDLTEEEEASFDRWNLLPHTRGNDPSWSNEFHAKQALVRGLRLDMWRVKQMVTRAVESRKTSNKRCRKSSSMAPQRFYGAEAIVLPFYYLQKGLHAGDEEVQIRMPQLSH